MNIIIEGKHIDLTPALKTAVEEKFGKLADHGMPIEQIRVELDVDHHHQKGDVAKVNAHVVTERQTFIVKERASDMHAAIDIVVPKLDRQMRSFREKRMSIIRRLFRRKRQ